MKNIVLLICVCLFIFSCTNNSKKENTDFVLTINSSGNIHKGNKELIIQEQDTLYHIYSNWEMDFDLDNGNYYTYINGLCDNIVEDTINVKKVYHDDLISVKFFSSGILKSNNKLITVTEVDTMYTFCVSKSDPRWTILENKETGKIVCEYKSMNNDSISINSELVDFYSNWFSKEKLTSEVSLCLKSNTLKHPDGTILSYDMYSTYNKKETLLRSSGLGGKLTYDMVTVLNELPKQFNTGDSTIVVFQNIQLNTDEGIKIVPPSVIEIIF